MIIVGFDIHRGHFVNAVGHLTDDFVLQLILNPDYSEFEVVFSSVALIAAVDRFVPSDFEEVQP